MILITGATGFVGSVLAKQLAGQNIPIRCIKRSTSVIPDLLLPYQHLIEWIEADILDSFALEDAFADITQVYHCAAWVSFKEADKEPMIKTNVTGTTNIVDLCLEYNARLVHVSSVAAIGKAKPGELITEKHYLEETSANHNYAVSKLESEMEVWRGVAEGMDAVVVNPSLIIGASAGTRGTGKIFESVLKGLKYYTRGSCGLVDVEDVAQCMIALMNSGINAERFILNAENWTYKNLFETIARYFGVKPPATEAKPWMLELAWRGAAFAAAVIGKDASLDKVSARAGSQIQNYSNSKIKKAIGFEFKPVERSIAAICEAIRVVH
jgi:dihydroflavonol-4-reductase